MNEKNFDKDVETYRLQLEKGYKMCTPCKRVLQVKLHKEKETLLSTKLLETRYPEKNLQQKEKQTKALINLINTISRIISELFLILVSYELYTKAQENLPKPCTGNCANEIISVNFNDMLPISFRFGMETFEYVNTLTQEVLLGFALLLQIIATIWDANTFRYTLAIDLLWTVLVFSTVGVFGFLNPLLTTVFKMMSLVVLLLIYKSIKEPSKHTPKKIFLPKPISKLTNLSSSTVMEQEDAMTEDSDDDVSLTKFGLHNFSEPSNETFYTSLMNGKKFTPRNNSTCSKPKLNSTFCVNTALWKSPKLALDPIFAKPSYSKYQKLSRDDSDSDLEMSFSSLSLGGSTKAKNTTHSMFSLRKYSVTSAAGRPLVSPSRLGRAALWLSGGYWSKGSYRQNDDDESCSSSQSSGYESPTSSMAFSQPPSREDSVCG